MSKILIDELKRVRSILSAVTGFEDDDQEYVEDARKSVDQIIEAMLAEQPAPVHCEAGPEYCPQCHKEGSLALAAAVRYVKNNTPNLVWAEIDRALTTPQHKPLTDEQIESIAIDVLGYGALREQDMDLFTQSVRAIEAAHGIKENT